MFIGCDGACIGIANIAPEYWTEFTTACLEVRFNEARETFMTRLLPLMQHCWAENQPRATTHSASTKEALRQLGVFSTSHVRPPEQDVDDAEIAEVRVGLEKAGLLEPQRLRASA
jgi:dihydrodipicolinate synthase/N-acetylneuraminate lyase